jgi:hypothetical protein
MKKIVCGFVFGLMLMVSGAQVWADYPGPIPPPNPKETSGGRVPSDYPGPIPPPNPKLLTTLNVQ